MNILDRPYFMNNEEWYYWDKKEWKYKLTSEAPIKAIESYKQFYAEIDDELLDDISEE